MSYFKTIAFNVGTVGFSFLETKEILQLILLGLSIILTIIQVIIKATQNGKK